MTQGLIGLLVFLSSAFATPSAILSPVPENCIQVENQEQILAKKELNLNNRYIESGFVNQVFKDNILLSLHYLNGREKSRNVNWSEIREPSEASFILNPGQVFAFHDQALPEFKDGVVKTMNSRFYADEGYKNSGYIYGDGVCHLASLINWTAYEAGLEVVAKTSHDFRLIPDVPREYGTSIRYADFGANTQNQNLYIKNTCDFPVRFIFKTNNEKVDLRITIVKA
jgi:hypothetical protein